MAELTLRIRAEYDSAIKCREEIDKTVRALQNLNENSSPQEVERLTKRYAELTAKYENSVSFIGKTFAFMKDALTGVGRELSFSADRTKDLGNSAKDVVANAQKRLQVEENIRKSLEKQRAEAEKTRAIEESKLTQARAKQDSDKQGLTRNKASLSSLENRMSVKYTGQDESVYSEADIKLLEKSRATVESWQRALDNSTKVVDECKGAVQDCNARIMVYDQLIEQSTDRTQNLNASLKDMNTGQVFDDMVRNLKDGQQQLELLQGSLKKYKEELAALQDSEGAKSRLTDLGSQLEEKTKEVEAVENLIQKQGELQDSISNTNQSIQDNEATITSLEEKLQGLSATSEEYIRTQEEINDRYAELEESEKMLSDANEELARVTSSINGSPSIEKLRGELDSLTTQFEKTKSIADNDLVNQKAIEDANNKISETEEKLSDTEKQLKVMQDTLTKTENVVIDFGTVAKSEVNKIFISEDAYRRYYELQDVIKGLREEMQQMKSGEFVDTQKLDELQQKLRDNEEEFSALNEVARHAAEILGDKMATKVSNALTNLYSLSESVRKLETEYADLEKQLEAANDKLKNAEGAKNIQDATNEVNGLKMRIEQTADKLSTVRAKEKDAVDEVKNLSKGFEDVNDKVDKGNEEISKMSDNAKSLVKQIGAIAGVSIGLREVAGFFEKAKEWRTYFQDIESSMKVFLGSAEKGTQFTEELKKYAYGNMFEFSDLAQASQQMISYGHNVESIIPRLDQLSNIATGTHGSLMELVNIYNRAKAMGVIDARGIQTWASKGVVIRDVLRDMGEVTTGTTVTFEQLNKVLDQVTGDGGRFHNLMGEMMNNISAEEGQLADNLSLMFEQVGEKFEDVYIKFIKWQSAMAEGRDSIVSDEFLDWGAETASKALDYLIENWETLIDVIKEAVAAYGIYKASMMASEVYVKIRSKWIAAETLARKLNNQEVTKEALSKAAETAAENTNTTAKRANAAAGAQQAGQTSRNIALNNAETVSTQKRTAATILLNKAFAPLTNPYFLIAGGLATLAVLCYKAYDGIMTQEKAQKLLNSATEDYTEKLKEQEGKDRTNIGIIQDKTKSLIEQTKAYRDLIAESEIFAKFSKEEIANMSSEQISQLKAEENAKKTEDNLRKQVAVLEELKSRFKGKGTAMFYAEDSDIDEVVKANGLSEEYAKQLKESIDGTTNLYKWADKLASEAGVNLQKYLKDGAETGVVEGFKKGFSNPAALDSASKLMGEYRKGMAKAFDIQSEIKVTEKKIADLKAANKEGGLDSRERTENSRTIEHLNSKLKILSTRLAEAGKSATENFGGKVNEELKKANATVETLHHELDKTTGSKRVDIEAKLKQAIDERDTWDSMRKLIDAGKLDTEVVMKITRQVENAELGDEKLVEIGKDYRMIDDAAQEVASRIESVKNQYEEAQKDTSKTNKLTLEQMLEDAGLTANGIDEDFSTAYSHIDGEVKELEKKLKDLPENTKEARKIELEIQRKKEQLDYIDKLKENLKTLAKDPFNIKVKIAGIIPDSLKKLFKRIFNINFDEKEELQTQSDIAQEEGEQAQANIDAKNDKGPEKKTGAEWKKEQLNALKARKKELEKLLKTPLTQEEAEQYQKELDGINAALKKGAAAGKKYLDMRAKQIEDELKHQDDMAALKKKAERSREDAVIAAIENNAERERKSREVQHRRTMEDITEQDDEVYKKIYNQRKADYENKNRESGMKYVLTAEGRKGWRGVKEEATINALQSKSMDIAADKLRNIGLTDDQLASIKNGTVDIKNLDAAIDKLISTSEEGYDMFKGNLDKKTIEFDADTDEAKEKVKALVKEMGLVAEEKDTKLRVDVDATQLAQLKNAIPQDMKYNVLPGQVSQPEVEGGNVTRIVTVKANTKSAEKQLSKLSDKVESMERVSTKEVRVEVNDEQLKALQKRKGFTITPIEQKIKQEKPKPIEFKASIDTEDVINDIEKISGVKTRPITYEVELDKGDVDKYLNALPEKKNIRIETSGDLPTLSDGRVRITFDTDSSEAMKSIEGIDNATIKPKSVMILADNTQAVEKVRQTQGVTIDDKNFNIIADAKMQEAQQAIEQLKAAFPNQKDRIIEIIGKDNNLSTLIEKLKLVREYLKGDLLKGAQKMTRDILTSTQGKGDVVQKIDLSFGNGNADMVARPMVDAAKMVQKGWKDADDAVQSVMVTDKAGKEHNILLSPVLPDGTILSKAEFDKYVQGSLSGVDDILSADEKKIVIGVDMDKDAVQNLRDLLEDLFRNLDPSKVKDIQNAFDAIGKQGLKGKEADLFNAQDSITQADEDKAVAERNRVLNEETEKQIQAMRDLVIQYGSTKDKQKALNEKYDELIREAEEGGDYVKAEEYRQKKEDEISKAQMEGYKADIDWEGVFKNLNDYSEEFLTDIRTKLKNYIDSPDITPENAQIVSEKIGEIDKVIIEKSENTFRWINNYLVEQKRYQEEAKQAAEDYKKAVDELNAAMYDRDESQNNIGYLISDMFGEEAAKGMSDILQNVKSSDQVDIFEKLGITDKDSDAAKKLSEAFEKLRAAEVKTAAAAGKVEKAESKKESADGKVEKDWKKKLAGTLGGFSEDVNKYLGPLSGIADKIGLGDLAAKMQSGMSAVNSAAGAAASFASGDYLGAAMQGLDALSSFSDAIGLDFGGKESDETYAEDMQRLTETNQKLDDSINRLNKTIQEGNIKEIGEAYEKQRKAWDVQLKNLGEMVERSLNSHKSGGLFSDGDNSSGYELYKGLTEEEKKALGEIFGVNIDEEVNKKYNETFGKANTAERQANNIANILTKLTGFNYEKNWSSGLAKAIEEDFRKSTGGHYLSELLSYQEGEDEKEYVKRLAQLRDNVELWDRVTRLADSGHQGAAEYLEKMADMGDKLRDIEQGFVDSLSNISFDSMFNDYISNLNNLDEANKNFADTFEGYIRSAIIRGMATETAKPALEKWQNALASYIQKSGGRLTEAQRKALMTTGGTYTDITTGKEESFGGLEEINKTWDDIGDVLRSLGLDKIGSSEQQKATFNSAKNITYEQADALVGVAMAQQIILEQIKSKIYSWNINGSLSDTESNDMQKLLEQLIIISALLQNGSVGQADKARQAYYEDDYQALLEAVESIPSEITLDKKTIDKLSNADTLAAIDNAMLADKPMDEDIFSDLAWRLNDLIPEENTIGEVIGNKPEVSEDASILTIPIEQILGVSKESRDIAADSRSILAGMAIHVEEIRDGVVDTIVPSIKEMRDDLNRVRKTVESQ